VDKPFQPFVPLNASTSTSNLLLDQPTASNEQLFDGGDKADEAREGSKVTEISTNANLLDVAKI